MAEELGVIKNTLKNYRSQLLDRSNVVATGVGYKITGGQKTSTLSIVCSVTKKLAPSQLSSKDLTCAIAVIEQRFSPQQPGWYADRCH
jgi:hypothetical protein